MRYIDRQRDKLIREGEAAFLFMVAVSGRRDKSFKHATSRARGGEGRPRGVKLDERGTLKDR